MLRNVSGAILFLFDLLFKNFLKSKERTLPKIGPPSWQLIRFLDSSFMMIFEKEKTLHAKTNGMCPEIISTFRGKGVVFPLLICQLYGSVYLQLAARIREVGIGYKVLSSTSRILLTNLVKFKKPWLYVISENTKTT